MPQSFSTPVGRVIAASANALVSHLENQAAIALLEQAAKLKALGATTKSANALRNCAAFPLLNPLAC